MDTSKINQTELSYSSGAGEAKVNLYTGRLFLEHKFDSIGLRSYELSISNIYNSHLSLPERFNTHISNKWKLNIQQYLYKSNGNYFYIDAGGMTIQFDYLSSGIFYDTFGLGLQLTEYESYVMIKDPLDNKMIFKNERLVQTISSENDNISKLFVYENDRIISTYDERKPDNRYIFEYNEDGQLSVIKAISRNKLKYKLKYYYQNGNLIYINKEQNGFEKVYLLYKYSNNLLQYAVYGKNRSAFKIKYLEDKVTKINTGVATIQEISKFQNKNYIGDDVFVGENVYTGDLVAYKNYLIEDGIETDGVDLLKSNSIEYHTNLDSYSDYKNYRTVTNEMGLKFIYYLNEQGYTSSIFEVNGAGDLRTLQRMPGIRMLEPDEGSLTETINNQRTLQISASSKVLFDKDNREEKFNELRAYREHDCENYINFVCSFWLKQLIKINNNKVKLTVITKNEEYSSTVSFDNTVIRGWQEIRIPIQIEEKVIKSITLEFFETDSSKHVIISDMKLYDSSFHQLMIGNKDNCFPIEKVTEIIYNQTSNISQQKSLSINENTYITEKDLQMTYLYKFKKRLNNDQSAYFTFFYNDCTKFIDVKSVYLKVDNSVGHAIQFVSEESEGVGSCSRANYYLKTYSPDGDVFTNQITYFSQNYIIDENLCDCMIQKTEANLYESGEDHKSSYILNCTDFKGKKLLEQDEYGVKTVYQYNNYGDIILKTIISNDGNERIEQNINYDNNIESVISENTIVNSYFDENDNIYKTDYIGENELSDKIHTTNISYDYFNENINKINNNLGSNNYLSYDEFGRINKISPKNINETNYYSYKFKYSPLGIIEQFFFSYEDYNSNNLINNLLLSRNMERGTDETIINTTLNIDEQNDCTISNIIDKYGRTKKVIKDNKSVIFNYENLDESHGAANITTMNDEFDNKNHYYNYNEDNVLISYGYGDVNDNKNNCLKVEKISDESTVVTFVNKNNGSKKFEMQTDICKDDNVLLYPKIKSIGQKFKKHAYGETIDYSYDGLGRMNKKNMRLCYEWVNMPEDQLYDYYVEKNREFNHNSNLIKKANTKIVSDSMSKYEVNYNYGYDEKNNLNQNNIRFTDSNGNIKQYNYTYLYNESSQLERETLNYIDEENSYNNKTKVLEYIYNNDGSIDKVKENGIIRSYKYQNGRLSRIIENNISLSLTYDNLGNTLTYGGNTYTYERGNLLSTFNDGNNTVQYFYNGQGKKYKKVLPNGVTVTYVYDNDKLVAEKHSDGREQIYLYDAIGVYAILVITFEANKPVHQCFYLERDELGNVISLTYADMEMAHYEYDAFGNCTITNPYDNETADLNPFRWKGMYCELESNLYFINNNTYSPELRQTLSMNYLDSIVNNSIKVDNLYAYNILTPNPTVALNNEPTASSGLELTYNNPQKKWWKKWFDYLWNRDIGKFFAIGLTALAVVITFFVSKCAGMTLLGSILEVGKVVLVVGATLLVGGIMAGNLSARRGKGFWNGFANYINENWSRTLAIEMAVYILTLGIGKFLTRGTKCFIAGTLILTSIGLVKIEDINVGDEVWTYNERTKQKELKKVNRIFRNKTKEWLYLTILNEEGKEEKIICTKNHKIYTICNGWVEANKIVENSEILLYNNEKGKVINKNLQILDHYEVTYNFEVEDNHNYYVGSQLILVHNDCKLARNMKKAGKMKEIGDDAHHLFPQYYREQFGSLGIDIDDASYGYWMNYSHHRKFAKDYNKLWGEAFKVGRVTADNAYDLAKEFMIKAYGKTI